jgi:hypothetical protein
LNWKLIAVLSLFGLAMGVGTVFFIPSNIERFCWPVIFSLCAVLIARETSRGRFLHGLYLGLANCVWVTGAHVLFFDTYLAHHPAEAAMMSGAAHSPQVMMLVVGPFIGVASGVVIGILAAIAGKVVPQRV